ncbi:MAG TPA: GTP 3',8-cyclase MoaA [Fimbriimonadales bacterium]|nr:GTP 3',8-cyclase MoaA [Fimbriimonadales bacterium]
MRDSFGRTIDYLRVSVTDRCNFRCIYCMPEEGYPVSPKEELLTFEEIARVVHIAANLGITKVRLTGGEPLIRKDLPELITQIRKHPKIIDISSTTNGYLLSEMAEKLARAGLNRVNVSLDTLAPEKFARIARRGDLQKVLEGIEAAKRAKLNPIKINCVLMKGVNDDEVVDFAKWTLDEEIHVRFIELMPIQWNLDDTESFYPLRELRDGKGLFYLRKAQDNHMLDDVQMRRMLIPSQEVKTRIENALGDLFPAEIPTNGPARTYRLRDAKGTIGFISQISNDLCERCNRLRLTADGQLRPCLMSDGEVDLRTPLRSGASNEAIAELILLVVQHKPERHYLAEGQKVRGRGMSQIGG